jgi:adenylate cyclase
MGVSWEIRIYAFRRLVHTETCRGPLEVGRQIVGEQSPFSLCPKGSPARLVIADLKATDISRRHALLELQPDGSMRIENLSGTLPIGVENGEPLLPHGVLKSQLPVVLVLGKMTLRVQQAEGGSGLMRGLTDAASPPSLQFASLQKFPGLEEQSAAANEQNRQLLRWLQTSMGVFHSAASSADFFQKAAQAVVDIIGLDTGRVLLWEDGAWQTRAFASATREIGEEDRQPSQGILSKVREEKRTFWELPSISTEQMASLQGVNAVVATPLLAANGDVLGAVYGDRRQTGKLFAADLISELEAMLVELIASGVAAGMARLQQEQAALTARVQFEQFFTRELSEQLSAHPDLLEGRDVEVSLVFCDIRGFSRISERLGPRGTVQWIGDVMGLLSDCVLAHSGVLVDYIGDELVAMWGAPAAQPEHARLASRAAIDMLQAVPRINQQWSATLREPMALGIGVNSGIARVGNTGSRHKFKYGPLGNTVNLASRVQGATKYLRSPILVTGSTHVQLAAGFLTRRLCQVRVVNIVEPVELFELAAADQAGWSELKQGYESALAAFERRDFRRAAHLVSGLLERWPDDGPSLLLLSRAADCLLSPGTEFNPVWELPGK